MLTGATFWKRQIVSQNGFDLIEMSSSKDDPVRPEPERGAKRLIPLCAGDCGGAAATHWVSVSCCRPLFLYRAIDSKHSWCAEGRFACEGAGHRTQVVQGSKPAGGELALLHHLSDAISTGPTWTSWCHWRGPLVPRNQLTAVEQAGCWLPPSLPWNSSSPSRTS